MGEDREPDLEDLVREYRRQFLREERFSRPWPMRERVIDPTMDQMAAEFGEPLWVHLELRTPSGWVLSRRVLNDVHVIRELTDHGWVEVEDGQL